jgi:hypothetical protein
MKLGNARQSIIIQQNVSAVFTFFLGSCVSRRFQGWKGLDFPYCPVTSLRVEGKYFGVGALILAVD